MIVGKDDKDVNDCLQHRIHIDKFTGGVIDSGLFAEKTIVGSLGMRIDVENRNNPDAAAGLLFLAIRDLAAGAFNIDSGYNVGRGFVNVKKMEITSLRDGKKAIVDFESGAVTDSDKLINKCLQAVNEWEEM